jgi:hypothetical protein
MDTTTKTRVVRVTPIEFKITINTVDLAERDLWRQELKTRHPCVEDTIPLKGWEFDTETGSAYYMTVVLNEDADYQQICALRAELKAYPLVFTEL